MKKSELYRKMKEVGWIPHYDKWYVFYSVNCKWAAHFGGQSENDLQCVISHMKDAEFSDTLYSWEQVHQFINNLK